MRLFSISLIACTHDWKFIAAIIRKMTALITFCMVPYSRNIIEQAIPASRIRLTTIFAQYTFIYRYFLVSIMR